MFTARPPDQHHFLKYETIELYINQPLSHKTRNETDDQAINSSEGIKKKKNISCCVTTSLIFLPGVSL